MADVPRTHRVAVAAYVFRSDQMLLLRRAYPPQTFAPPGGRLEPDEAPTTGLQREIREETGLKVRVLGVASVWYGSIDGLQPPLLCVNFVAEADEGEVRLSEEHTEYRWVTRSQIEDGEIDTVTASGLGYRPEGILDAFDRATRSRSLARMLP
jgi:ADP-ribose pyrophosphatase YjhB (NUDIX family)